MRKENDNARDNNDNMALTLEGLRCEITAKHRQVFGLTGTARLGPPTGRRFPAALREPPVRVLRRSFLSTAAGQLRILTGFPLSVGCAEFREPTNRCRYDTDWHPVVQGVRRLD